MNWLSGKRLYKSKNIDLTSNDNTDLLSLVSKFMGAMGECVKERVDRELFINAGSSNLRTIHDVMENAAFELLVEDDWS